jgi:hypothetical protein
MESAMRKYLIVLILLAGTEAHAEARFSSNRMSCDRVQQRIVNNGAAVVSYTSKRGNPLYDRFVADMGSCPGGQVTELVYIRASDTQACPVLRCEEYEPPFNFED